MTLSLYDITVPALLRGLENLSAQVDKAVAFAAEQGIDEQALLQARLHDDMIPFVRQVQIATDTAKFCAARLAQVEAPAWPDDEAGFTDIKARIDKAINYLRVVPREGIDGKEQVAIDFRAGPTALHFTGQDYVRNFVLPNFYFHCTIAYAILRHRGVPLGKLDYLGRIQ